MKNTDATFITIQFSFYSYLIFLFHVSLHKLLLSPSCPGKVKNNMKFRTLIGRLNTKKKKIVM